jgi:acetyl-CoA synthetase
MYLDRDAGNYDDVHARFSWAGHVPETLNLAHMVCDRWADDPARIALVHERINGGVDRYSYAGLRALSDRCANLFDSLGLTRGDRVAVLLQQHPESVVAHLGAWKRGLVSCPMSVLFGPDALAYRIKDSGARVVVTNAANAPKVLEMRAACPTLEHVFVIDDPLPGTTDFHAALAASPEGGDIAVTGADDPAWISYTSGTTGPPKGALQPHRMLLGLLPSLEFVWDFFPRAGDVTWSPADWSWMGGFSGVMLPSLWHGLTTVSTELGPFDPENAYRILATHSVTCTLLVPTMLKMMRQVPAPRSRYELHLRVVKSGAEAVGAELLEWASRELGVIVNEVFGQTECMEPLGNNAAVMPIKPGSIGRPLPGHVCAIVDDDGHELGDGELGHIAVRAPHPVMFLGYLNRDDATREKYRGEWLLTGDLGVRDADGYYWFRGRADDVITSAGYRIGPAEIEDALLRHPAVANAAVIGVPDPARTEAIKAFVVLAPGRHGDEALVETLRDHVRIRLARHEVPRFIEFVDSLPMTTTHKVMRRELRERERQRREA